MMLMHAAAIAAFNAWAVPPIHGDILRISWICVLILIYAMIAPSTPRRMLVASLVAASLRSARLLDRLAARWTATRTRLRVHHLLADLCLRVRRRRAGACPAAPRPASARGAGSRELSAGRTARDRRHGRSVARGASSAGARCGDQAGAAGGARRARRARSAGDAQAVRARGAGDRGLELAAHDPGLRLRHHAGRHVLLRDGAAHRPRPRVARPRIRPAAAEPRHLSPAPGVPLAGRCARARPRASRHQAGQHLCLPHGPRVRLHQGARLRAGQDAAGGRTYPGPADAGDDRKHDAGHAGLHGSRSHPRATRTSIAGPTSIPSAASPTSC